MIILNHRGKAADIHVNTEYVKPRMVLREFNTIRFSFADKGVQPIKSAHGRTGMEEENMRIGTDLAAYDTRAAAKNTNAGKPRFSEIVSDTTGAMDEHQAMVMGSLLWQMTEADKDEKPAQGKQVSLLEGEEDTGRAADRSEAVKVYEEAFKGGPNPLENLRQAPKVPYGHLAKDGVIIYNGVLFTCDERSNSICLGDVSDPKKVINVTLSGGGHLKVNRDSLGQLSKAIGMFSPEDVNLIMRAIHQDTKVQSMQKEIEDLEASVGEQIASGNDAAETDGDTAEEAGWESMGETNNREKDED